MMPSLSGSGLNGFAAAITLQQQWLSTLLVEGADTIGGAAAHPLDHGKAALLHHGLEETVHDLDTDGACMRKIVLAGGSGYLGTLLKDAFVALGWEVVILSRQRHRKEAGVSHVFWDGEHLGPWVQALEGADTLINLSGKSVQCRFTAKNRAALAASRLIPTDLLGRAISTCRRAPRLWINFSGISIFSGLRELQDESSETVGNDFLAKLSQKWEETCTKFKFSDTLRVILRVSPVLSRTHGMFAELLPLVKWGLGGAVAQGDQYVSWIHQQDFVAMVQWIIERATSQGIYHACSPKPTTNAEFMQTFRETMGKSFGLPLPRALAYIGAYLKGIDPGMLLQSVPAAAVRAEQEGFLFRYGTLEKALSDLV